MEMECSNAITNPRYYEFKERLNLFHASVTLDNWNDALLPTRGLRAKMDYELSLKKWKTAIPYQRILFSFDNYIPWSYPNGFRIYCYACYGNSKLTVYKYFNQGQSDSFIGMDNDQIVGRMFVLYRFDYQIEIIHKFFIYACINQIRNFQNDYVKMKKTLSGIVGGVKARTPFGLTFINFGFGSRGLFLPDEMCFHYSFGFGS